MYCQQCQQPDAAGCGLLAAVGSANNANRLLAAWLLAAWLRLRAGGHVPEGWGEGPGQRASGNGGFTNKFF
jgi:hypothetical protein